MKLRTAADSSGTVKGYMHHCPGCEYNHVIYTQNTSGNPTWEFDGNEELPSFDPSIRVFEIEKGKRITLCHYFLKKGKIQFLSDCNHNLAGQTVDLPDIPEGY